MTYSTLSHLECPKCGRQQDADRLTNLCECGSPLLVRYDLAAAGAATSPKEIAARTPDLWRYHEILPVRDPANVVTFGEGMTPLLSMPRLGGTIGVPRLMLKDEGLLPTGSFKARGAAVGVSKAKELGAQVMSMPTNGNAGSAWAAYATRGGMTMIVSMPVSAPTINRTEVAVTGAELTLVRGHIGQAGQWVAQAVKERGEPVFDVATLKEPYRIEGKKTMGLEIAEQLGWRMPDVIVYPTGGGVGLIGIYKALNELRDLGWVDGELPRLVAVQATGCQPIVKAFEEGKHESEPWPDAKTVAFGITVPKALGDFLVLDAVYDTNGTAIAVEDEALLEDLALAGRTEGMFISPEGAATITAVKRLRERGWLSEDDEVVVLNTGNGLVYPDTFQVDAPVVDPIG